MATITNFGSCAIDHVFSVGGIVRPGETLPATGYQVHGGGKGLNQSLALAYAGARVRHVGRIGRDGLWLKALLDGAGVDTRGIQVVEEPSGVAIIQVTPEGQNAIIVRGGANQTITPGDINGLLEGTKAGEFLLLQNETSCLPEVMAEAARRGLRIAFNAAPMTVAVKAYPLGLVDLFILNEVEAEAITGFTHHEQVLDGMLRQYPESRTILTLGEQGAIYGDGERRLRQAAFKVNAVDTTAAGDTFIGYFLAGLAAEKPIQQCLQEACHAGALCVTRAGAASSIPRRNEVDQETARLA